MKKTATIWFIALAMAGTSLASEQYMAVCTSKEHQGTVVPGEYPLTAWLDSRDAANKAGKEHEQRTKGHPWTIKTRQKP